MKHTYKKQLPQQSLQHGSTLFICLMLLLAISIISLAAMRTSLLELVIANNKQQYSNTFQASEELINTRLGNLDIAFTGTEAPDDLISTESVTPVNANIGDSTIKLFYRNKTPAIGWELGSGIAFHFQIEAKAKSAARNAVSEQRVGFYVVAPTSE